MTFFKTSVVVSVLCAFAGMAGAAAATKAPTKKAAVKKKSTAGTKKAPAAAGKSAKSAPAKKPTGKAVATAKTKAGKKAPAATWRSRQQNPTPDRYKEIQQALVDKGYLKSEPSGVWDAESVAALQRFQTDQKMTPSGKINAPSLIGLGLGAKSAGAPEAAPISPTPAPPQ